MNLGFSDTYNMWEMQNEDFQCIYEPRVEDPVVVAEFETKEQAESYMQDLESQQPKTYKFCQIVEKG